MFTGIIEEVGTVKEVETISEHAVELTVEATVVMEDIHLGDSISVNGICLTVKEFTEKQFKVEAMPETIKSTSLKNLTNGSHINLERAMAANGRFGGHFVSGHVDTTGQILRKQEEENAIYYEIEIPAAYQAEVMHKGSITVDGVSLTVFGVNKNVVTISLIPHTVSETILGEKGAGDVVNIETDMLAKYARQMIGQVNGQ